MPDISIQFYASPSELEALTSEFAKEVAVYLLRTEFPPFQVHRITIADLPAVFAGESRTSEIVFLLEQPKVDVNGRMALIDANPNLLSLRIGQLTKDGLGESFLAARTDDPKSLAAWNLLAKKIKKVTKQGVTAINRKSGATASVKATRYTEGARQLEESGVEMIPPQGKQGPKIVLGLNATK